MGETVPLEGLDQTVAARSQPTPVRQAMLRLLAQIDRPCTEAELEAVWPENDDEPIETALLRAGERLGLKARIERVRRRNVASLPTPCLLLSRDGSEAWLARGRSGQRVILVDPVSGNATAYTPRGVAALATRAVLLRPLEERRPRIDSLIELFGPRFWPALGEVALASVVLNLLALATPIFMMTVYNKVINHGALATLDVLAIGMVSLLAFELLLRGLRAHVASHTGARLDVALGGEVMHQLLNLPYRTLAQAGSTGMVERLRQLDHLRSFLSGQLPLLTVDLLFVGLFLAALFIIAPTLGWITAAALPLFVIASACTHYRQQDLIRAQARAAAAKSACLAEAFGQALTVKALALEHVVLRRFERRLITSAWAAFKASSLAGLVGGSGQVLQSLTALALVYVGAKAIVAGELTIGALVAGSILSARAITPMRQLFGAWTQLQQTREAFAKLSQTLAEAPEPLPGSAGGGLTITGRLHFEDVTFRYAKDRPAALDSFSLNVAPGTMLGIVGAPGSGKSTLVKLLLGLEMPESGRVLVDEHDVRQLPAAAYRSQIGIVPQEVQLFAGTIAENIAIGAADRSFARVVAAAKFVGLHDIVQRLPDGYETVLGEHGRGLSMGQRQLVAIARAVVRNPRLMVLDEATSALDSASEAALLANLRRAGSGRTILLVTHRLPVLQACDRAVLLEQGRIVRVGTPAEVLHELQGRQPRAAMAGVREPSGMRESAATREPLPREALQAVT